MAKQLTFSGIVAVWVVLVAPLPAGGLRRVEAAYAIVDIGFVGLTQLVGTAHVVHFAVFHKTGTGLVETEGHIFLNALAAEVEHPIVVAGTCLSARFASYTHLLYRIVQIVHKVDGLYQRRGDNGFVFDGKRTEDRQAIVGTVLVFDGAANQHVVVAVAPVGRDALHEEVYALGEEVKPQVGTLSHHGPALGTPGVGILQQEVGGEAGEDHAAGGYLIALVATAFDGEVEGCGLAGDVAAYLAAIHLVLPIDIAVFAAGAYLGAAVPRVPVGVYVPVFAHGVLLVVGGLRVVGRVEGAPGLVVAVEVVVVVFKQDAGHIVGVLYPALDEVLLEA